MDRPLPTVTLTLWRAHAIVLYDWLMSTDLDTIPVTHKAEKRALADLLARIQECTGIPYGASGEDLTEEEIEAARAEVSNDMDS